jgi:hypothetical protein
MDTLEEPNQEGGKLPDPEGTGSSLASRVEVEDLEGRVRLLRRKGRDHLLWTLLGISPAAIIPAFGLLLEGSTGLLALLGLLVTLTQGFAWVRVSREAESLEKRLRHLREGD